MDKYWDIIQAFAKVADAEQYDPFAFFSAEFAFSNHSWTPKTVMSYSKEVHGNAVPVPLQPMMDAGPTKQLFLNTNLSTMADEGSAKPTKYGINLCPGLRCNLRKLTRTIAIFSSAPARTQWILPLWTLSSERMTKSCGRCSRFATILSSGKLCSSLCQAPGPRKRQQRAATAWVPIASKEIPLVRLFSLIKYGLCSDLDI